MADALVPLTPRHGDGVPVAGSRSSNGPAASMPSTSVGAVDDHGQDVDEGALPHTLLPLDVGGSKHLDVLGALASIATKELHASTTSPPVTPTGAGNGSGGGGDWPALVPMVRTSRPLPLYPPSDAPDDHAANQRPSPLSAGSTPPLDRLLPVPQRLVFHPPYMFEPGTRSERRRLVSATVPAVQDATAASDLLRLHLASPLGFGVQAPAARLSHPSEGGPLLDLAMAVSASSSTELVYLPPMQSCDEYSKDAAMSERYVAARRERSSCQWPPCMTLMAR
jgi:hypothetical protein